MKQKKISPNLFTSNSIRIAMAIIEAARSKNRGSKQSTTKGGREPVEPPNNNHQKWTTVQSIAFS